MSAAATAPGSAAAAAAASSAASAKSAAGESPLPEPAMVSKVRGVSARWGAIASRLMRSFCSIAALRAGEYVALQMAAFPLAEERRQTESWYDSQQLRQCDNSSSSQQVVKDSGRPEAKMK